MPNNEPLKFLSQVLSPTRPLRERSLRPPRTTVQARRPLGRFRSITIRTSSTTNSGTSYGFARSSRHTGPQYKEVVMGRLGFFGWRSSGPSSLTEKLRRISSFRRIKASVGEARPTRSSGTFVLTAPSASNTETFRTSVPTRLVKRVGTSTGHLPQICPGLNQILGAGVDMKVLAT